MTYQFDVSTDLPLALTEFDQDLATGATLHLGYVSLTPTGELNDDQIANATSSISAAIKAATGADTTVSLKAIQS